MGYEEDDTGNTGQEVSKAKLIFYVGDLPNQETQHNCEGDFASNFQILRVSNETQYFFLGINVLGRDTLYLLGVGLG